MQSEYSEKASEFEQIIGYDFKDKDLLTLALTHPSWSGEMKKPRTFSNQRLEFLGDAVLECIVSDHLYHMHPELEEGELTRMRASLVCEAALCECARSMELGSYLLLGKGENSSGGRNKDSILSDAFEAVLGAVYLDGGFEVAVDYVSRFCLGIVKEFSLFRDEKSRIQELVQQESGAKLFYETTEKEDISSGLFHSVLYINDVPVSSGFGRTKKAAEQKAAIEAVRIYQEKQQDCI